MNQSRSRRVDLAGLLSNVTALHTLFSIFAFRQTGRSDPAGLLIWCVCLSLTCGGLALFLRRPRTQRSVLLLALAALALQGAVVWLWGVRYPSLLSWLCLLAMWGFSYFRCYELLIRPTPAEQLMVSFETASLVLLAAALLWYGRSRSFRAVFPLSGSVEVSCRAQWTPEEGQGYARDRKNTRLNSSHPSRYRMPSSA